MVVLNIICWYWLRITYWLVLYGSFANFIAVLIAAFSGAGRMMPIAGGQQGSAFEEGVISFLMVTLTLVMLMVCVIVLKGLYGSFYLKSK